MFQKNFTFLLTAITLCVIGVSFFYNQVRSNFQVYGDNISSISINEVEKQTVIYKEKQSEINKVNTDIEQSKSLIREIQNQKLSLEKDLITAQTKRQSIEKQLSENNLNIISATTGKNYQQKSETKQFLESQENELSNKRKENLDTQEKFKLQIEQKSNQIIENETNIKGLEKTLDNKKSELIYQLNNIINIGFLLASNYAVYVLILIVLWVIYRVILRLISQDLHNEQIKTASKKAIKVIWIILSILVIFYGFAGQFNYILASLGFVSAALVFALQNFVASFFIFIIVSITKIIKVGDIVKVGPDSETYTGEITMIGRFYTFIKEISPQNQEQLGRTVSVPNSFLLIHPVINFTVKNKILWQNLKIVVNGNSDQIKAKQILQKILTIRFEWVKDRKHQYLDQDIDITEFTPKISTSLEDRGVAYTLHFPCHFQKYNEIYDQLLTEVLTEFKKEEIKLGFIV
jgi:small-conductance mechanosensitive channel